MGVEEYEIVCVCVFDHFWFEQKLNWMIETG